MKSIWRILHSTASAAHHHKMGLHDTRKWEQSVIQHICGAGLSVYIAGSMPNHWNALPLNIVNSKTRIMLSLFYLTLKLTQIISGFLKHWNHWTIFFVNDDQPKCPHWAKKPTIWRSKIEKDMSAKTNTCSPLHPLDFCFPLSGQSNGWWVCCLLMHTADKLSLSDRSPGTVWFVKDRTRQDESAAQIEKGH